jgi:TPP-dependent pyruvate/acetoin dehydrogenase alpha subunit
MSEVLNQKSPNNGPDNATLLEIYRLSTLIRRCGERFLAVIRSGRIAAPYYSPRGQEVLAAAMAVNLNRDDYAVTIYRGLHDHLAKGVPLKELWAEYAGKASGSCKGKGGPMHITHPASGVVVTTGVVGSGIPIANGLALASQIRGDGKVTMTSFGDGATNIGAFHEALNLASIWKLPVIFLCQNNLYAEHTSFANGTACPDIATRGIAYNIRSVTVNGNDPVEMWRAARDAVSWAREGKGPTLLEAKTFRFEGHILGDTGHYIPKEEFDAALKRDPVPLLRQFLIDEGIASAGALEAMEQKIDADITEAADYALSEPYPDLIELGRDVFAEEITP